MIRLLLAYLRPFNTLVRTLKALVEVQKEILDVQRTLVAILSQDKGMSLMTFSEGEPGGESYHWISEEARELKDLIKQAYEQKFGISLGDRDPEAEWLEENDLLKDYIALKSKA
jgi:hypothetical protein